MALIVDYITERGNTVPYPPLFDDIRRNYGFVDLRARPDLVDVIPEVSKSSALRNLLIALAEERSNMISVGCDLGFHKQKHDSLMPKYRSGGYIQFGILPLAGSSIETLRAIARTIEFCLRDQVSNDFWIVKFALCRTHFKLEKCIESNTLWIWFDAAAMTQDKARSSRERLISTLAAGLHRYTSENTAS